METVKLLNECKRLLHIVGLYDLNSPSSIWNRFIKFVYILLTTSYIIPMVCISIQFRFNLITVYLTTFSFSFRLPLRTIILILLAILHYAPLTWFALQWAPAKWLLYPSAKKLFDWFLKCWKNWPYFVNNPLAWNFVSPKALCLIVYYLCSLLQPISISTLAPPTICSIKLYESIIKLYV